MVACIPITQEKVRGEIWMGGTLICKTPFLTNFNVTKSRTQISNTFSATFDVLAGTAFPIGEKIIIKAGLRGNLKKVFTGVIESTSANPSFGKPSYFTLQMSGRGVLSELENKKFSRRLKSDGQGLFAVITGGSANRPKAYTSLDKKVKAGRRLSKTSSPNPADATGENSPYIKFVGGQADQGSGGLAGKIAGKPTGGDRQTGTGTGGLGVHDHSDLDNGGPAFAVYSAD